MSDKASHKKANYRKGKGKKVCANCTMFRPPSSCTSVVSPIRPEDLCDYFKAKSKGADWWRE